MNITLNDGMRRQHQISYSAAASVRALMRELDQWYRMNDGAEDPVALATELHWRMVSIRPMVDDGNGRVAKLAVAFRLVRHGLLPPSGEC